MHAQPIEHSTNSESQNSRGPGDRSRATSPPIVSVGVSTAARVGNQSHELPGGGHRRKPAQIP
eukprot:15463819-Alexandrium_andersonii.AAC.1